jgi:hypothetical protein
MYFGYDIERYIRMDWKARKIPGRYNAAAMEGTILVHRIKISSSCYLTTNTHQCTDSRDDQPNMNREIGMKTLAINPISSLASALRPPSLMNRGSKW